MSPEKVFILFSLALIVILSSFTVKAAEYKPPDIELKPSYPSINLKLDENKSILVGVKNNLSVQDKVELSIKGEARSLLEWKIKEPSGVTCSPDYSSCEITLNSDEEVNIPIEISGVKVGHDMSLILQGTSETSKLSDTIYLSVSVNLKEEGSFFSAPGLSWVNFSVLGVLSFLILVALRE